MQFSLDIALRITTVVTFTLGVLVLSPNWAWLWRRAQAGDRAIADWLGLAQLQSIAPEDLLTRVLTAPLQADLDPELLSRVKLTRASALLASIGVIGLLLVTAWELMG